MSDIEEEGLGTPARQSPSLIADAACTCECALATSAACFAVDLMATPVSFI